VGNEGALSRAGGCQMVLTFGFSLEERRAGPLLRAEQRDLLS
jgi:hypothetical protein